jgi:hypothetical protein
MYQRIKSLVHRMAAQFNAGEFHALSADYVFPLPVQVNGSLVVLHTPSDMAVALANYRDQNTSQGLSPSYPNIVAIDLPRNGRFRLWVDWTYTPDSGPEASRTQNLYFCSLVGTRIQIEMVQYLRVAAQGAVMQSVFAERRIA